MRAGLVVGILLIVLGLVSLIAGGFSYTTREKVLDIGPIEATAETQKTFPVPPILGGIVLAAGVALVLTVGRRR